MTVELCNEPYRHYKVTNPDTGKVTWTGANKQRIQSVTDLLEPDLAGLVNWAIGRTVVAAEEAVQRFLPEAWTALAQSVLDLPGLMQLTGSMPDAVRDAKAELGTDAHSYLAWRLTGSQGPRPQPEPEYGYRLAIDEFLVKMAPEAIMGDMGWRVERAVGSFERAIAGTYDAQVWMVVDGVRARHRIDLKSSNSVYGKAFAQLGAYEDLAVQEHGEAPSDFLTIVHIDPLGGYKLHSIAVGSPEHDHARAYFEAAVTMRRSGAVLSKALR